MTLKSRLKHWASQIAPEASGEWLAGRARAQSQRMVREWGLFDLNQRLIREVGDRVLAGPFRGLILTPMSQQEHVGPYLLGTYEMELHPWWEQLMQRRFAQIIDVGAKFGYYAVGLARHFAQTPVVAFDTDPWARQAVKEMAEANQTRNVEIESRCSPEWLTRQLRPGAFVISDCEGYEGELFHGVPDERLATATLIVELHDCLVPGVTRRVQERFERSHFARSIASRSHTQLPQLSVKTLSPEELRRAGEEVRAEQTWMLLEPRSDLPSSR